MTKPVLLLLQYQQHDQNHKWRGKACDKYRSLPRPSQNNFAATGLLAGIGRT
jgi:hypothetical protein